MAVLIVSYNTRDALRGCLRTLLETAADLRVIVVDNASSDGSVEMVRSEFPGVLAVEAGANLGFGRGTNLAASRTTRDFLLTLNPDCAAPPAAIAAMAGRLAKDEQIGFVGPRVALESGAPDRAGLRGDPDPLGAFLYLTRLSRLAPRSRGLNRYNLTYLDYDSEHELLAGTGGCLLLRAAAFHQVGGFDEAFFMYGEDLDLCRRIREAGWRGLYLPSARVTHTKGESTRRSSARMLVEFHRAMWVYYRKHEAPRRPAPLNWLVAAGIVALGALRLARNALRQDGRVSAR
ncbi:MAG TPA: glycosyltransferase family 2 protein [Candidatus Dormibacteraeota bacterium]|nr:glycosyltransferase family 2 protein [Candidatus Dormibacteraeota bacterium]